MVVHPANVPDRDGATVVPDGITRPDRFPDLRQVWADAGYAGRLVTWAAAALDLTVTVVRRPRRWVRVSPGGEPPPLPAGFQVLPRRWVVERTFALLGRNRRLSKDYEGHSETEEAWVSLGMTRLMLARLAR